MGNRVVITGMGVVSPNGVGLDNFKNALYAGQSGIRYHEIFKEWGLGCQIGGIPPLTKEEETEFTKKYNVVKLRSPGILYGLMAGVEAWLDAGLPLTHRKDQFPDWNSGTIFGTSCSGVDAFTYNVLLAREGNVRKVGGRIAQQAMNSGVSAYLGGILGLGNQVTTNASEASTGVESIWECFFRIQTGQATRMIAGSAESSSPYVFQAYDSSINPMTGDFVAVQEYGKYKENPENAYTPLNGSNAGMVIGSGSGALVLESLASAKRRGARIYAEVLNASISSGGAYKKYGGITRDVTARQFKHNIQKILKDSHTGYDEIDYVNANIQNYKDITELEFLADTLQRRGKKFPYINSTKSLIGHCLSASGTIETVATILQMHYSFLHPSLNAKPIDPNILALLDKSRIPIKTLDNIHIRKAMKLSLATGDLSTGVLLKKWEDG